MPIRVSAHATFLDPAEGMRVDAVSGSGFPLRFDTAPAAEGGVASGPTETVLAALAACTGMDVASIMRKKRQAFRSYEIHVTAEKADAHPQVFTAITVEHRLAGEIALEAVRRSIELSATTYCPVSAMLSASVRIEHRYAVRRDGVTDEERGLVVITGPAGDRSVESAATS